MQRASSITMAAAAAGGALQRRVSAGVAARRRRWRWRLRTCWRYQRWQRQRGAFGGHNGGFNMAALLAAARISGGVARLPGIA